jgi:uncharacterized metal-binding protein YceD (DUF177 family)
MQPTKKQLSVMEPLDLRFLPDEGLSFAEPLNPEWLDGQLADAGTVAPLKAKEPGEANVDVEPLGAVHTRPPIRVHGTVEATLSTTCVRCLETVDDVLEADLDLTLFPAGAPKPARAHDGDDDEEGLSPAEMDEGVYADNTIDLPSIIREALILEIAMNPACADETACTARTQAMLAEANRASEGAIPDRWAALRRLKDS